MSTYAESEDAKLAAFDSDLEKVYMRGQWTAESALKHMKDGPRPGGAPYVWPYADVMAQLERARDEFPETLNARRSLSFVNPELEDYTLPTLGLGIQMIDPGELAWPHRHTASAMRFVIEGDSRLASIVDGEPQMMESYDLIVTPKWTWHGHHNQSDHPVTWVDILDVPVFRNLNQMFYEASEPSEHLNGYIPGSDGSDSGPVRSEVASPIHRFAWKDTEPKLRELAKKNETDPIDGIVYRYTNPETGGPVFNLMDCRAHLIRPGDATKPIRRSSAAVYFVISGSGHVTVNGKDLSWSKNDCFCVPNWTMSNIANDSGTEELILFSVTDRPLMEHLEMYIERDH